MRTCEKGWEKGEEGQRRILIERKGETGHAQTSCGVVRTRRKKGRERSALANFEVMNSSLNTSRRVVGVRKSRAAPVVGEGGKNMWEEGGQRSLLSKEATELAGERLRGEEGR
jgi:hypothetical protein